MEVILVGLGVVLVGLGAAGVAGIFALYSRQE